MEEIKRDAAPEALDGKALDEGALETATGGLVFPMYVRDKSKEEILKISRSIQESPWKPS